MKILDNDKCDVTSSELTNDERQRILLMLEEEKLSHDVYRKLYVMWKLPIFNNISISESRHITAIKRLATQYQIDDITSNLKFGEFVSPVMSELYDKFITQGEKTSLYALKVGAEIEEHDITELQSGIDTTNNKHIKQVYRNLQRASRNHLRAFDRNIRRQKGVYVAKYLSAIEYQEIVTSPKERSNQYAW